MVMSYQKARDYEDALRDEFGDDAVKADVTGGLPENPSEFDIEQAREEAEDAEEYEGPAPVGDPWIEIDPDRVYEIIEYLKTEPGYEFNSLHCLGGDHRLSDGQIVVIYHLYSYENEQWIILKAFLPDDEPVIDSVTDLYNAADWHEREAYDMLGIRFDGHPDLRRLLLPEDWDGHPLRKDYQFPEYYRGIPVDWDDARVNRTTRDSFYDEAMELEEMDIDEELGFPDPNQSDKFDGEPTNGR